LHYRDYLLTFAGAIGDAIVRWQYLLNGDSEIRLQERNNINAVMDALCARSTRVQKVILEYKELYEQLRLPMEHCGLLDSHTSLKSVTELSDRTVNLSRYLTRIAPVLIRIDSLLERYEQLIPMAMKDDDSAAGLDKLRELPGAERKKIKQILTDAIAAERQLLIEVNVILKPELKQAELWKVRVELAERQGDQNLAKRARRRLNSYKDLLADWENISKWGNSIELPEGLLKLRETVERIESSCGLQVHTVLKNNNTLVAISLLDRAIFLAENLEALLESTETSCVSSS
jgi:hypothetical protein